ncbi:hypothetical protein MA9V1_213 [Chryseobacterium phage MA9V-1]|nr:hypothetical protein MA9V1_213 [Chryseobacterium phage MA9V-1]
MIDMPMQEIWQAKQSLQSQGFDETKKIITNLMVL